MSIGTLEMMTWAFELRGTAPLEKLVAIYFAGHAGGGGEGDPAMGINADHLADWCGCKREEAVTALWTLARHGLEAEETAPWQYLAILRIEPRPRPRGIPEREPEMTLYVVSTATGVKIGITAKVKHRMQALAAGSPERLTIEFQCAGPRRLIQRAESQCHSDLRPVHIRGEWFDCKPERAVKVAKAVLQELGVLPDDE